MARKRSDIVTKNCEAIIRKSICRNKVLCMERVKKYLSGTPLAELQYYLKRYKNESFAKFMRGVYLKGVNIKNVLEYIDALMEALNKKYYVWPLKINHTYFVVIEGKNKSIRSIYYNGTCLIKFVQTAKINEKFIRRFRNQKNVYNSINFVAILLDLVKYSYWLKKYTIGWMEKHFLLFAPSFGVQFLKFLEENDISILDKYIGAIFGLLITFDSYLTKGYVSIHAIKLTLACLELAVDNDQIIDAIHIFLDSELCVNLKKSIVNSPPTKFTIEDVEDEFLKKWNLYR